MSKSTIEKQAFALIENEVEGPTRLHYIVNINFVAWMHLKATDSSSIGSSMKRHLQIQQQRYERNILNALHRIGVLDPTNLPLFQALLSGVSCILGLALDSV